jgi:hypothetical protein
MTRGLPVRQANPILRLDGEPDLWAIIPGT